MNKIVSTDKFEYEFDDDLVDLSYITSQFIFSCDDLSDKAIRLYTRVAKDDFAYREFIASTKIETLADGIVDIVSVMNEDRQRAALYLIERLMQQAFHVGAARAIEGLDPAVSGRRVERMKMVRSKKATAFTVDQEKAIEQAIREKGPKVANILKDLHQQGIPVSDDTIRRRKKIAASNT